MKKVLITGAAGFVGFHLAQELAALDSYELFLADNLQRGRMDPAFESLLNLDRVHFLKADLTDPKAFEGFPLDVGIHIPSCCCHRCAECTGAS